MGERLQQFQDWKEKVFERKEEQETDPYKPLIEAQLVFLDKQFQKAKAENPNSSFRDVFEKYTSLFLLLKNNLPAAMPEQGDKEVEEKFEAILDELENIYNSKTANWAARFYECIRDNLEGPPASLDYLITDEEDRVEVWQSIEEMLSSQNSHAVGMVEFEDPSIHEGYDQYGFNTYDDLMKIHIGNAYEFPDIKISKGELKNSFSKLAEIIVDRYPQTQGIIGESWLMDTSLARLVGFKRAEKVQVHEYSLAFWSQFLDENGDLYEESLNEFLETGVPPHKNMAGYISIEDFLNKHLPDSRRGEKIILRVPSEEKGQERIAIAKEERYLGIHLRRMGAYEIDDLLKACPLISQSFTELGLFNEFREILNQCKAAKRSLFSHKGFKELREKFGDYWQKRLGYVDKELIIPKKEKNNVT
jgi:hypothetical protein